MLEMSVDTAKERGLFCLAWGVPYNRDGTHFHCPVIVRHPEEIAEVEERTKIDSFPKICACECQTCKRAWWGMGRPMIRDGKVINDTGGVLA